MANLGKLVDMDFKFVLPGSYINFDIQTNFEVNQNQIGHSIPKKQDFFEFLAQNFFGGLNQKSAMICMCKIHIYINSETFRQIHLKGFLVNDTLAKWGFEIF